MSKVSVFVFLFLPSPLLSVYRFGGSNVFETAGSSRQKGSCGAVSAIGCIGFFLSSTSTCARLRASEYGIKVPDRILFAIRRNRCCGQPW